MMTVVANILDPIHDTLDPTVWDAVQEHTPVLKPQHKQWILDTILDTLKKHGYGDMDKWLEVYLTGSLTTYQYSDESDCDCSLFVNTDVFPEWSRAEMIGIMVSEVDGHTLPGTTHPMQCYVVARGIRPQDLYKQGLRSGYFIERNRWVVPPERDRVHNVEHEQLADYQYALQQADKMEHLLRYEPDKAVTFWHQIHARRMQDQKMGKGDYSQSNIIYKFLSNRGLFPQISEVSGEHIAAYFNDDQEPTPEVLDEFGPEYDLKRQRRNQLRALPNVMYHVAPTNRREDIAQKGLVPDAARINNESNHEPGVYLWEDPEVAMKYRGQGPNMYRDFDMYAVQVPREYLKPDPWFEHNYPDRAKDFPGAWYTPHAVAPERVHPFYDSVWHPRTAGAPELWSLDDDAIHQACKHLDIWHPVSVKLVDGYQGKYNGRVNGVHDIHLVKWLKPESASKQLWHELTHAKQFERDPKRWEGYLRDYNRQYGRGHEAYIDHPWEAEARNNAEAHPFPLISGASTTNEGMHVGQAEAHDTSQPPSKEAWSFC